MPWGCFLCSPSKKPQCSHCSPRSMCSAPCACAFEHQITVVACASAAGHAIPPMVIFNASKLNSAWTKGEVVGTKYGLSVNEWINTDLFEAWFVEHFIPNAVYSRPLFLLLDGHYQPQVIGFTMEHNCIILCLTRHTSHSHWMLVSLLLSKSNGAGFAIKRIRGRSSISSTSAPYFPKHGILL